MERGKNDGLGWKTLSIPYSFFTPFTPTKQWKITFSYFISFLHFSSCHFSPQSNMVFVTSQWRWDYFWINFQQVHKTHINKSLFKWVELGLANPKEDTRQRLGGLKVGLELDSLAHYGFFLLFENWNTTRLCFFPLSLTVTLYHIWFHFIYILPYFTIDIMSKKTKLFQHLYKDASFQPLLFLISSFNHIIWTLSQKREKTIRNE